MSLVKRQAMFSFSSLLRYKHFIWYVSLDGHPNPTILTSRCIMFDRFIPTSNPRFDELLLARGVSQAPRLNG